LIINRFLILKGPTRVAIGSSVESKFEENYFFSDGMNNFFFFVVLKFKIIIEFQILKIEPGYYKAGDFGIRIESILRVVNTTFKVI
jgi:hypothetical protein